MAIEDEILAIQLKNDTFYNEDGKVSGIANLAVDKGFNTLSAAQKRVLTPFLTHPCDGVTNPGGHHNDCEVILTDEALRDAYDSKPYYDALLCENCINEKEQYAREWERIERE
ncbi:TPA: hypothetical protein SJ155_000908 [Yersinia enterocolitica]|uniref:hypothetical protein n=1 Tax=Yersinia TaxID=629 RepID=UPI000B490D94|nr:hypothetical protein [Yersinia frederiksenii]EKN4936369.1 hypothetical protein [Yersinia enterocolitica]EKN5052759.1 hypothetical protein [Yersinia enterocolitica]EKN5145856.1 hypothetical protein [Yersinia enterocolitica]OWF74669.1 hypothetical protein B4902_00655 [Yersinia frederiksenii]HDL7451170.1 hypothetical protein [Yersinia enterocolitica]